VLDLHRREIFWLDANAISNRSNFGFGSNYEKGQTGILRVLCTRKRNLVLGANAQRISRLSYTAVVRTNGYLRSTKLVKNLTFTNVNSC
jgi:hypothetical protein